MAGIIGIYGLVVSVLISDGLKQNLPLYTGFIQLGAGLSVGLAGLAAGYVHSLHHSLSSSLRVFFKANQSIPTQVRDWHRR